FTESPVFERRFSLRDQLERAALSVSNNIAEGFERGTTAELVAFLYIARGSAGEVRSMLCFVERRKAFADFKSQISDLKGRCESISRQLYGWMESLKESVIKGQKYLTPTGKQRYEQKQRAEAFLAQVDEIVRKAREQEKRRSPGSSGMPSSEL
ncbi:MAG: four helix bundle protein, partial [Planctomycetes bacterium]|nr:four helix bundle protein [Planctomycetota bacterium]